MPSHPHMQAAAAWLLEQPDLPAAQASWQAARAARREQRARTRAEREAAKKQIVDRFQLQVGWAAGGAACRCSTRRTACAGRPRHGCSVTCTRQSPRCDAGPHSPPIWPPPPSPQALPNGTGGGKGKPAALKAWGGGSGGDSKARYRDGALVSTRGEKFVFEKVRHHDEMERAAVWLRLRRLRRRCGASTALRCDLAGQPSDPRSRKPCRTCCRCRGPSGTVAPAARCAGWMHAWVAHFM